MDKTKQEKLQDKAIDLKGKKYILVADRVSYFNENYPNGSINTELVSPVDAEMVVIKATVVPDCDKPNRQFTDYSQAKWGAGFVNKTSAIENASTSAVGRCLAYMGIGIIESIASADEVVKAQNQGKSLNEYRTENLNQNTQSNKEYLMGKAVENLEADAASMDLDTLNTRVQQGIKYVAGHPELIARLNKLLPAD